jgi:hypothetical protein
VYRIYIGTIRVACYNRITRCRWTVYVLITILYHLYYLVSFKYVYFARPSALVRVSLATTRWEIYIAFFAVSLVFTLRDVWTNITSFSFHSVFALYRGPFLPRSRVSAPPDRSFALSALFYFGPVLRANRATVWKPDNGLCSIGSIMTKTVIRDNDVGDLSSRSPLKTIQNRLIIPTPERRILLHASHTRGSEGLFISEIPTDYDKGTSQ